MKYYNFQRNTLFYSVCFQIGFKVQRDQTVLVKFKIKQTEQTRDEFSR